MVDRNPRVEVSNASPQLRVSPRARLSRIPGIFIGKMNQSMFFGYKKRPKTQLYMGVGKT